MRFESKNRWYRFATKLLVWSLVLSVLAASLPIPVAVVSYDAAEGDFPCRNGSCGCKSAFQCWTSCCCHSAQERLDWAAQHGVAVPEYAQHLRQLAADQKAQAKVTGATKPACCQKAKPALPAKPACCAKKESATTLGCASATAKPRTKVVLSMFALGCRGSSGELASLPWAIVELPIASRAPLGPLECQLVIVDRDGPKQFYPPELPPPRVS